MLAFFLRFLSFAFISSMGHPITRLRYVNKRIFNIMKVYIERDNMQL